MNSLAPVPTEAQPSEEQAEQPGNIEAEQALLGALLVNNDVYDRIADTVSANHFYDPVHGRIFEIATSRIKNNALASPITLKPFLESDPGLRELGGPSYLARLAGAATSVFASKDYAKIIHDLALRRSLISLGHDIIDTAARIDVESDPQDQIANAEKKLYDLAEQGHSESGFKSFLSATTQAIEIASAAIGRGDGMSGMPTGLIDLDRKLGGLHKSDLLIIAGRPSMGKTALATNIAFNIARSYNGEEDGKARKGGRVGFFSLEMSSEQLAIRVLSETAEIPSEAIRNGNMDEESFRKFAAAATKLESCPLYIDDTAAIPINQLAARARRLKRTRGLDVLVVDYLQLVRPSSSRESRVNEISEISQSLKAIAKDLDIPVVALSQLSRQVEGRENKKPQLSDLRESGSIEQDADVVMFVYREEYYLERDKPKEDDTDAMFKWQQKMDQVMGSAEIIVGKQRHGPIGTVKMSFDAKHTKFSNLGHASQMAAADAFD